MGDAVIVFAGRHTHTRPAIADEELSTLPWRRARRLTTTEIRSEFFAPDTQVLNHWDTFDAAYTDFQAFILRRENAMRITRITAAVLAAAASLALASCSSAPPTVDQSTTTVSSATTATSSPVATTATIETPAPVTVTAAPPPAPVTVTEAAAPPVVIIPDPETVYQAPTTIYRAPTTVYQGTPGGSHWTNLPSGLLCRDMRDMGFTYQEAASYWWYWGQPDRMDIDLNGVPCETVWAPGER